MSAEASGEVSFRDANLGDWNLVCWGRGLCSTLVTLRANETMGRELGGVCSSVGVALKSNCLIHNFSWGWSCPDSFYNLSWQAMQRPVQLGWGNHGEPTQCVYFCFKLSQARTGAKQSNVNILSPPWDPRRKACGSRLLILDLGVLPRGDETEWSFLVSDVVFKADTARGVRPGRRADH